MISWKLTRCPMYSRGGKRVLDLLLTIPALILLSPFLLVLALLVRWKMGSPVLFYQERPGLQGELFTIHKFRTMVDAYDEQGEQLPDSERLTRFGRFLRSSSLDELPELFNVLKGEMSLVGPRPLLKRYYPYFTSEERLRFSVRPGITGLAQVAGRNDLRWDIRLATDVEYVKNLCLREDIKILLLTVWRIVNRHGVRVDPRTHMLNLDEERRQGRREMTGYE
jgi:undecaprenyl phosphate N,N'-diacetylbacillosamine 1-phosphate transferase